MKKGAVIVALATIVLLAIWAMGDAHMGACEYQYQLVTPDGWTLDLAGPRFAPGTVDSLMAHSGLGLPPIEHVTQQIYSTPGSLHKDTLVKARTLDITLTTHALTRKSLHQARAKLMDAMRWDRGSTNTTPSILRYTVDGVSRDLYVTYAGDVTRSVGRFGQQEIIGFRLAAYNPFIYDPETQEQVLDWANSFTTRNIARYAESLWDPMGPPAIVGGFGEVRALAVDPATGDVYIGGDFTNWDNLGVGPGNYMVKLDHATQTWQTVGAGPGVGNVVRALLFGPDGILYVGGSFTVAGGDAGDYVMTYDPVTNTFSALAAGGTGTVYALAMDDEGNLYIGGSFQNWNGIGAADRVVQWDPVGGYAAMDAGFSDGWVETLVVLPNGHVVAGGSFSLANGVTVRQVAEWEDTAWVDMGGGFGGGMDTTKLAVAPDGKLYAVGTWNTTHDGTLVNYGAVWNGTLWAALGSGFSSAANSVAVRSDGMVFFSGQFATAGGIPVDRLTLWNGSSFSPVDFTYPGAPALVNAWTYGDELYTGFSSSGTSYTAGQNVVVYGGNAGSFPTIEIKNQGALKAIRNKTTARDLLFTLPMLDGEIVTIDLSPGNKTVRSTMWGNRLGKLFPNSDAGSFCLESAPRAAYGGVEGANLITVFITDADPREQNDDNNQLSGWEDITGISQHNTDLGRLYVEIVADGGGFYHVDLYMDAAMTELVGHTGSYNGVGAQAITADNDSGLGGSITVDAVVGADADIQVWFTIVTVTWRSRWWDMDNALQ
jgi:hypothetical protein